MILFIFWRALCILDLKFIQIKNDMIVLTIEMPLMQDITSKPISKDCLQLNETKNILIISPKFTRFPRAPKLNSKYPKIKLFWLKNVLAGKGYFDVIWFVILVFYNSFCCFWYFSTCHTIPVIIPPIIENISNAKHPPTNDIR